LPSNYISNKIPCELGLTRSTLLAGALLYSLHLNKVFKFGYPAQKRMFNFFLNFLKFDNFDGTEGDFVNNDDDEEGYGY